MTQTERILAALNRGPITQLQALRECGCLRLAARIKDLREAGNDITTVMVDTEGGHKVAQYHLNPSKKGATPQ